MRELTAWASLWVLMALSGAATLDAQGISVWVDQQTISTEQQLRLEVTIEGSGTARPLLPALDDFTERYLGHSSEIQFVNGRVSRRITHSYALVPRRAGDFTIGPIEVEIGGQIYRSRPFRVQVESAASRPVSERTVFVRARVSPESPYVGQQIIYTWRFFRRLDTPASTQLAAQEFDGFEVEDLGRIREFRVTIGDQEYEVSEIRKALFARQALTLVIPATEIVAQVAVRNSNRRRAFDDLFGRAETETRILRTDPIELVVRDLPPAPSEFSGLIGDFRIESEIAKRTLEVGGSTTQRVTIAGDGNVQMIAKPRAELPLSDFKVYEDQPSTALQRTRTGLRGSKSFPRALVPLRPGSLEVPAVALVFFDPEVGIYRTSETKPVILDVSPSSSPEDLRLTEAISPSIGKVGVRILANDLLPIHRGLEPLVGFRPGLTAATLSLLSPPVLFLALLLVRRRRRQLSTHRVHYRRRGALKKALRQLADDSRRAGGSDCASLSRVVRQYVGDRRGEDGTSRTGSDCIADLLDDGLSTALADRLGSVLWDLDAAHYGASLVSDIDGLQLGELLAQIDEELNRC